jgi:hypothetical protein
MSSPLQSQTPATTYSLRASLKAKMAQRRAETAEDGTSTKTTRLPAKISRTLAAALQKQGFFLFLLLIYLFTLIRGFVLSTSPASMDTLNALIDTMRRGAAAEGAVVPHPPHGTWEDVAIVLAKERLPTEYRTSHDSHTSTHLRNPRGVSGAHNLLGIYVLQMTHLDFEVVRNAPFR